MAPVWGIHVGSQTKPPKSALNADASNADTGLEGWGGTRWMLWECGSTWDSMCYAVNLPDSENDWFLLRACELHSDLLIL